MAWEDLRPRAEEVPWYYLVWFSQGIPKCEFIMWLVMKRKLKTQDLLQPWDFHDSSVPVVLACPLCERQQNSHKHLFFECDFSTQVWNGVRMKAEIQDSSTDLDVIISTLLPIAKSKSVKSVTAKLLLLASIYYIWQERNRRLFSKKKSCKQEIIGSIINMVRMKLLTCRFKKTRRVERFLTAWDLPFSLIN
uniref:uncharacterized protein LOC122583212 n=1 Tax=Erigeron canadensis TaxID=72917 RepID=UPI001CB99232|nr:uncharacterized protein LOC122583212 [Erigeron canadensis]